MPPIRPSRNRTTAPANLGPPLARMPRAIRRRAETYNVPRIERVFPCIRSRKHGFRCADRQRSRLTRRTPIVNVGSGTSHFPEPARLPYETILYDADSGVATITLNQP